MGDAACPSLPGTWVSYLGKKWRFWQNEETSLFCAAKGILRSATAATGWKGGEGGRGKRGAGTSISESQTGGVFKTGFAMHRQICTNTNTDIN